MVTSAPKNQICSPSPAGDHNSRVIPASTTPRVRGGVYRHKAGLSAAGLSAARAFGNDPGRTSLVGHRRIGGIVRSRHRCVRDHNYVVKVGTDPAVCPSAPSGLDRGSRGLSDVVGSYPERETNHWATLNARAVISGDLCRSPDCFIRRRQLTLEGFMSCRGTGTVSIFGKQINTHPPQLQPITHPAHGRIFPDHAVVPVTKHPPGRMFRNDP